jgi:hypothetical protein
MAMPASTSSSTLTAQKESYAVRDSYGGAEKKKKSAKMMMSKKAECAVARN